MITGLTIQYFFFIAYLGLLGWAAFHDAMTMTIPNRIPLAITLLFFLYAFLHPASVNLLANLATAAGMFVLGAVFFHFRQMGGGDVKLMAAIGLWAGPYLVLPFFLIMSLAGGVLIIFLNRHLRGVLECAGMWLMPRSAVISCPRGALPYGLAIAAGGVYVGIQLLVP